jgi:hypothetical protein
MLSDRPIVVNPDRLEEWGKSPVLGLIGPIWPSSRQVTGPMNLLRPGGLEEDP